MAPKIASIDGVLKELLLTAALTTTSADQIVAEHVDATGLPGVAVAVTKGDEVVLAKGYGVTEHTPMRLAILSKSFIAAAVVQLVDQKKIELDEPVAKQLPEFTTRDPRGQKITVRQVLNQTSGLADDTADVDAVEAATTLEEAVGAGLSNAEIAKRLHLVEGTVKTYMTTIMQRLGARNRVQAAITAYEAGLVIP